MISLVVFTLFGVLNVHGQVASIGRCDPAPRPMSNFDVGSYLGLWYEVARTNNVFQSGQCVTAMYTLNETSGLVDVYNAMVTDNVLEDIKGTARLEADDGSAALIVSFPTSIFEPTSSNYWVLDTDYTDYALVYDCQNFGVFRLITAWKLGRTSSFSDELNSYLDGLIDNIAGIRSSDLLYTDHSDEACFIRQ